MRGEYCGRTGETLSRRGGMGGVAAKPGTNHPEKQHQAFHLVSSSQTFTHRLRRPLWTRI
jgi:hypothetical protein